MGGAHSLPRAFYKLWSWILKWVRLGYGFKMVLYGYYNMVLTILKANAILKGYC